MDKLYIISKCGLRGKFEVEMETLHTSEDAVHRLCDLIHITYTKLAQDSSVNVQSFSHVHDLYNTMCGQTDPKKLLKIYDQLIEDNEYHDHLEFSIGLEVIDQNSKPESYHDSEERVWDNLATHNERFAYDDED